MSTGGSAQAVTAARLLPFANDKVATIDQLGRLTASCADPDRIITTLHGEGLSATVSSAGRRAVHVDQTRTTFSAPAQGPGRQTWRIRRTSEAATVSATVRVEYRVDPDRRTCYVAETAITSRVRP